MTLSVQCEHGVLVRVGRVWFVLFITMGVEEKIAGDLVSKAIADATSSVAKAGATKKPASEGKKKGGCAIM